MKDREKWKLIILFVVRVCNSNRARCREIRHVFSDFVRYRPADSTSKIFECVLAGQSEINNMRDHL